MNESEKKKPSGVNYIELCPPRAPLKCHQNLSDGNVSQMKASWASFSCRHPTSRYFWHFSSVYYTRYFKIRLDQHIFRVFLVFFCFFFQELCIEQQHQENVSLLTDWALTSSLLLLCVDDEGKKSSVKTNTKPSEFSFLSQSLNFRVLCFAVSSPPASRPLRSLYDVTRKKAKTKQDEISEKKKEESEEQNNTRNLNHREKETHTTARSSQQ